PPYEHHYAYILFYKNKIFALLFCVLAQKTTRKPALLAAIGSTIAKKLDLKRSDRFLFRALLCCLGCSLV
ncbi:hypothetical protein ACAG65_06690, partial [Halodesulfovibrio aestuarii]|uniref:hypothetical protein n=1 Tax=Halodesulfovibrio aestuarii TaxID=126333 RepID=UPI003522066B